MKCNKAQDYVVVPLDTLKGWMEEPDVDQLRKEIKETIEEGERL